MLQPRTEPETWYAPCLGTEHVTFHFVATAVKVEPQNFNTDFQVQKSNIYNKSISFLNMFIDYAITVVPFPAPLTPLHPVHPLPPTFSPYSSCPWVIHVSSLASTFPILFLPSPCLFSAYQLCYLFCVPFPPLSPSQSPVDNPPCFYDT